MGKLLPMRGEACLTDLQQGQYHHVFSGGRRWGLGLGRAAAMVWQLAVGIGRVARVGRTPCGGSGWRRVGQNRGRRPAGSLVSGGLGP